MAQDEDALLESDDLDESATNFEDIANANEGKADDGCASGDSDTDSMTSEEKLQLWRDLHVNSAPCSVGFSGHGKNTSNATLVRPSAETASYADQEEPSVTVSGVRFSHHTEHNIIVNHSSERSLDLYNTSLLAMPHGIFKDDTKTGTKEHPLPAATRELVETAKALSGVKIAPGPNLTSSATSASAQVQPQSSLTSDPPTPLSPFDPDLGARKTLGITPEEIDAARQNCVLDGVETSKFEFGITPGEIDAVRQNLISDLRTETIVDHKPGEKGLARPEEREVTVVLQAPG
ncbi:hypothetical protein CONPUDRAFT_169556 [Coniophora puteana RWD-64-598 SS2]|uniref:Uncharacterized protein n=1 Tax=Coniophora puteana (strain RWD-64-598) TaxID=741705 RepID=A0A5M3M7C3_CONPW|nr:uncharacterized protein CONPUDRAFT_169556 [Coniophora puteana RWD-64-598 SS2]EIW75138.1 hypothetical protein CONPUDRAFT_169556 [Coniophora puteana RWD-64-598 SS2]